MDANTNTNANAVATAAGIGDTGDIWAADDWY